MPHKTIPDQNTGDKGEEDPLARLIREAQAQPGIEEVMNVYRQYAAIENAAQPYSQLIDVKRIVSLSDNSTADQGGE